MSLSALCVFPDTVCSPHCAHLCSTKELNNFIRISVGLPEHTDKLLAALATLA